MNIFIIKLYFLILYTNFCYGVDDYFLGVARQELQRRKLQSTNSNTKDDEQKCINDLYKYMEALEANNSWAIYSKCTNAIIIIVSLIRFDSLDFTLSQFLIHSK